MKTPSDNDNKFHKSLIDNLYDGVYFVDKNRLITYWNKGAERITGYRAQDIIGRYCHANVLDHVNDDGQHYCTDRCPLMATIQDGEPRETEVHLRHADGYRVPVLVRTSPIFDEQNNVIGAVEVFSNNQSLLKMKRRVDELERDVFRDALTGVGNRKFMEIKINTAIAEYHQHQIPFGLLFLDIDHFKTVNDTYGHQEGDLVLQNTARNLTTHLRGTDICGRWGGEEFIAILYNINLKSMARIAEKIRAMIANSAITVNGEKFSVTTSIGATLACEADTMESIIERADQLMYRSKQGGRNRVTLED
jgi:diguanylate cyclase (GGDEF)-like protein/PAS domain S-box-containing protein